MDDRPVLFRRHSTPLSSLLRNLNCTAKRNCLDSQSAVSCFMAYAAFPLMLSLARDTAFLPLIGMTSIAVYETRISIHDGPCLCLLQIIPAAPKTSSAKVISLT